MQIAGILHSDAMKISSLYIKLMRDKALTVLEGLIEHLPQAMIEFSHAANLSITTKVPVMYCSVLCIVMYYNVCSVLTVALYYN